MIIEAGVEGQGTEGGNPGADDIVLGGDLGDTPTGDDAGKDSDAGEGAGDEGAEGRDAPGDAGDEGDGGAPESYADFTLPEGLTVDEEMLKEAAPIFKEMGLTQEQAQKQVDLYVKGVQAAAQKQVDAFNQLKESWRESSKTDKEFGNDKFDENLKVANSALTKFGTPEFSKLLRDYGLGNHPEVIRFAYRVGKLTQEDNPGAGDAGSEKKDRVSVLYPT